MLTIFFCIELPESGFVNQGAKQESTILLSESGDHISKVNLQPKSIEDTLITNAQHQR